MLTPAAAQDLAAKADAYVKSWIPDSKFRGTVLIAKGDQIQFAQGYGNANDEWAIANTPSTVFRLGSITKQFTAVCILRLAESGKLKLDDPVSKHYADAPAAWEKITVRHLLNHTSGIKSYTSQPGFMDKRTREKLSPAEVVKLTQDLPLEFAPGEKYAYNNTGYVLLGYIIEKLTGESYADHVRKTLFEPLAMKDSGYDSDETIIPRRAAGYTARGTNARFIDMSLPHAAGSLYSTVGDLLKWNLALHGGKLVSSGSYQEMITPGKGNYGYGLVINKAGNRTVIQHGGGIFGFSTMLTYLPEQQVTVAVLSNREGDAPGPIGMALTQLAAGEDVRPRTARVEISLADDKKARLAGDYELRPGFVLKVFLEGSRLMTQATGQGAIELFAMSESKFFPKVIDAELEFELDGDGPSKSLTLRQGGAG